MPTMSPNPATQSAKFSRYRTTADLTKEPLFKYYGRSFKEGTMLYLPKAFARRYVIRGRLIAVAGAKAASDIVIVHSTRMMHRASIMHDNAAAAAQQHPPA